MQIIPLLCLTFPQISSYPLTSIPQHIIFFFFNDTAPPEFSPLPLHAPLPISLTVVPAGNPAGFTPSSLPPANSTRVPSGSDSSRVSSKSRETAAMDGSASPRKPRVAMERRSEEHTSELQSRLHLVCRLLLEKKKNQKHW